MIGGLGIGIWLGGSQAPVGGGGGFTNLVTNGDFAAGSTGWSFDTGVAFSGGKCVITSGADILYQNISATPGTTYTITFDYTCTSGSALRITSPAGFIGASNIVNTQSVTVDGATHTFTATFAAVAGWIGIEADTAPFTGTIDNVVVHT